MAGRWIGSEARGKVPDDYFVVELKQALVSIRVPPEETPDQSRALTHCHIPPSTVMPGWGSGAYFTCRTYCNGALGPHIVMLIYWDAYEL